MKKIYFLFAALLTLHSLDAAWVLQNGKLKDADCVATMPVEKHYSLGCQYFEAAKYDEAAKQFSIVSTNFPNSNFGSDSFFYLGVCYFELRELDFANEALTNYLRQCSQSKNFETAMAYKFHIANALREGERCRFYGTKQLPKWASGTELAIKIYDEVIQSIPCHDFAAESLYAKGYMLWEQNAWGESIEAFQTLIRRFPKHSLAPQGYLAINRVFIDEAKQEFQNPDLLQLAQINLKRFKQDYPRDENIALAEKDVQMLKELYAEGLYNTACFYEWKNNPGAAVLYYKSAMVRFPETEIAVKCRESIMRLKPCAIDPSLCKLPGRDAKTL
jgi:outer membrane protein assembly factor BamD (BamD/ComL family)